MKLTPKQAGRALSALDHLLGLIVEYAEIGGIDYKPTVWEQESLARLRWHLMGLMPDDDPRFATVRETE